MKPPVLKTGARHRAASSNLAPSAKTLPMGFFERSEIFREESVFDSVFLPKTHAAAPLNGAAAQHSGTLRLPLANDRNVSDATIG